VGEVKMSHNKNNNDLLSFLKDLELLSISLVEIKSKKKDTFALPAVITNSVENKFKNVKKIDKEIEIDTFMVYSTFTLEAHQEGKKEAGLKIQITYLLEYKSKIDMTADLFEEFKESYLMLNIYPYFRFLIQEITSRMGLPPLVLNVIQVKLSQE
jgi:preprotein translocase subunit SecB